MDEPCAIIFDCDGTLVDSMPSHYRAWLEALRPYGLGFDEDRFYGLGGWPTLNVAELVIQEAGLDVDPHVLADEKERLFETEIAHVQPIEPVVAVARDYAGKIPLAVATGAIRRICIEMLDTVGLRDLFAAIVTAEDVPRHKPAPDTYLQAAEALGVDPACCRVYEDTDPGVESGRAAGMQVVDVRTFHRPERVSP